MSGLAYCVRHPEAARRFISISSAARGEPFSIAVRSLQREMIRSDPNWMGGHYSADKPPIIGQRLARKLGMITYRSPEEWRGRFGRDSRLDTAGGSGRTHREGVAEGLRVARLGDRLESREVGGHLATRPHVELTAVEGDPERWSPETEILLFTAARRDHLEKTIRPALDRGAIVVSDRFADSTRVYQGAARGELRDLVDTLHDAVIAFEPFLTFVIDMDPEIALARGLARRSGEDRFEDMGAAFQQKLRCGFRSMVEDWPERCRLIDGARSKDAIAADVASIADALF